MKIKLLVVSLASLLMCVGAVQAQEQSGQQGTQQTPVMGQPPSVDIQGIRKYLLGPGDVLDVRVFGQPDMNALVEIDGDGNITSLPFVETPIRAQCRSEKQVQRDIATAYSKYIKDPQVSVRIAERKSRPPATVFGAVRAPAIVTMMRRVRLQELLAKTGGTTERANGTVQIFHTEAEMCPEPGDVPQSTAAGSSELGGAFELYKIDDLVKGKEQANPFIRPGDIVIVTEAEPVYITGAVVSPQGIYMRDKLTLGRALAMVGGPRREAKSTVHIYRVKPGQSEQEDIKVDYTAIRKGQQPDVPLQAYDIVDVPESGLLSKKRWPEVFANTVKTMTTGLATHTIY